MKYAASEEGIRKFLFSVAGYDYYGSMNGNNCLSSLRYIKAHLVYLIEQGVGKFDVGFIYLVNEEHNLLFRDKGLSQFTRLYVLPDVGYVFISEAAIVQPLDSIVNINAL